MNRLGVVCMKEVVRPTLSHCGKESVVLYGLRSRDLKR